MNHFRFSAGRWTDRLLCHWLLAAAMILVAAALTIPQLDRYAFGGDSMQSYAVAYRLLRDQHTPLHMLKDLYASGPDQTVLYYFLLYFWGYVAGESLAGARLISLFCGLLSLAMVYRLARDFISPVAGVFAAFILLCNVYFAFYYAHVRYYTLVVFLAATILWLYLRLTSRRQPPQRRDYLTLILSCYALISTHAFGFLIYLTVSLYHLLFVGKGRRWFMVMVAALLAMLLAAPQLFMQLTAGVNHLTARMHNAYSLDTTMAAWVTVISNGNPLLLVISLAGVVIGWRRGFVRGGGVTHFCHSFLCWRSASPCLAK